MTKDNILPVVEIKVSEAWIDFINFVQTQAPYANIEVKFVNGQPSDLLSCKPKVRFGKKQSIPKNFQGLVFGGE